jgi:ABC superfamily ATP binding cassette transporter, membrane protein
MTFMWIDHFENAYRTLKSNRVRTLLTVLGITIGIASVTCILAISGGVKQMIGGQVEALDGRIAVIRPSVQTRDPNALINPIIQQTFSVSTLTEADIQALTGMKNLDTVVPLMTIDGSLKTDRKTVKDSTILATTPSFTKVAHVSMKAGQFLDDATDSTTAVIGEDLSLELFNTDRPIGQLFTMRGQQFTVIGVMKRSNNPINFNNVDLNRAVIVNFERGKLFHQGRSQIQQINLLAKDASNLAELTSQAKQKLLSQHLDEEDFSITTGDAITRPSNQLFNAITDVMTAIAAISLFVGGIGIMNIMLVGVAERTREIGIRKAVGANQYNITAQFLMESLIISLLGGLFGYILGYVMAFSVSVFLYFTPAFTWQTAATAFAMATVVGVVFGSYPAIKAARKNTIVSLRQYH